VTVQISLIACKVSLIASDHHRAGVEVELGEKTASVVRLLLSPHTPSRQYSCRMQPHHAALLEIIVSHHQQSTISSLFLHFFIIITIKISATFVNPSFNRCRV
jgi:hypothetical protein